MAVNSGREARRVIWRVAETVHKSCDFGREPAHRSLDKRVELDAGSEDAEQHDVD